jgi:hypothetical protein
MFLRFKQFEGPFVFINPKYIQSIADNEGVKGFCFIDLGHTSYCIEGNAEQTSKFVQEFMMDRGL